jgi:hypothetical protein
MIAGETWRGGYQQHLLYLQCRDEIPQILLGLQAIYSDRKVHEQLFSILLDTIGKAIKLTNRQYDKIGITEWRQYKHRLKPEDL